MAPPSSSAAAQPSRSQKAVCSGGWCLIIATPSTNHRAILDEIWARNPDGARRAMHRLMDLTERNITSALSRRHGEAMAAADASREHDA
jgi:DNA-binding GntR family transcriptional regulator